MKTKIKTMVFLVLIGVLYAPMLQGQTFEEYKKQRQQEMQDFKDERTKQMQRLADEFTKYTQEQDQKYTEYLKERWRQFELFQGQEPPAEPKPEEAPVYKEPQEPDRPLPMNPIPVLVPSDVEPPVFFPEPVLPRITKPEPENFPVSDLDMIFYDFPIALNYDQSMKNIQMEGLVNEEAISEMFNQLSATNYNTLLEQLYDYSKLLNLNDWGYYRLVNEVASNISGADENTQKVVTWFLLARSGYKSRVAYFDEVVYLLLPIRNQVYDVKYFNMDGIKYYLMDGDVTNIYTYEMDFPEAHKTLDLNMYKTLSLGENLETKNITFNFRGKNVEVPVKYNQNTINFYSDYPHADIKVYFDAMVSPETKNALLSSFLPMLDGMNELEAANTLLHFVQTGFAYQTDQEQFGYEKFFFAEEAFYYPYCDCEDRSVLFSYLAQSLLGLEVIGLNYPGHMATAVCFSQDVSGDYFEIEGKKFVVCDPTYIGAPAGLTMPEYKNEEAKIVMLENRFFDGRRQDLLWDEIITAGGNRGDNGRDMIVNEDGSTFVTGYFTEAFSFGNVDIAGGEKPAMFAMMVDAERKPLWFSSSNGNGKSLAYNMARDENQNIYITGTFEGELEIDEKIIETKNELPDIFIAKYSPGGELQWLNKANIDTANQPGDHFLNFVSKFDNAGKHLGNDLYFENSDFENYGILFGAAGEVLVSGAFNKTTGMNVKEVSFNALGEFDVVEALKTENDRLITNNYEKTIAGLFAMVNLVQSSGVSISGTEAREVLDKYNPTFKSENPNIYNTVLKINFIKNQDGVITVKTDGGKEMSIDMMRVSNDARLKVSVLENGDARIDVLSGIRVGKAFWWYDLNHIILYKANGDLLFDYDVDHEVAVKNLKIDILY